MRDVKLTEAQRRAMEKPIYRHFDVYGGHWWTATEDGAGERLKIVTVRALENAGMIALGETVRVYSGRQRTPYRVTPSGYIALSKAGGNNG